MEKTVSRIGILNWNLNSDQFFFTVEFDPSPREDKRKRNKYEPVFLNVYGAQESIPRHYSTSLCSLASRYDNPIPTQCLAPIDFLKIPALYTLPRGNLLLLQTLWFHTRGQLSSTPHNHWWRPLHMLLPI